MKVTEFQRGDYVVTSYGNGTAYFVVRNGEETGVFVQGDDADTLREQTNDFENVDIFADYFVN